jgi:cytoskeletal protein RodZ
LNIELPLAPTYNILVSTVSQQLRAARESQNLSVQQLGEITKIRSDHIRALEEGNFDIFSAPVYIKGFVRNCATLLKMDVPRLMAELDAELKGSKKFAEPPPLSDERTGFLDFVMLQLSKLDWRKSVIGLGVLVIALIIFLVVVIVRHYHKADPLANLKPGLYHSTQSVSGQTLPLPSPRH